jgi:pseudaminic acid cytidylyltransferase
MRKLAIIPARGGSKRIPRKNIKEFSGKPIIVYSIEAAISSGIFDEVMVSTDDDEITEIAKKNGASVPFKRSKENANDFATIADVVIEVINQYQSIGIHYDLICVIYPLAPFIKKERINQGLEMIVSQNYNSVLYVVRYSYPIQRALKIENHKLSLIWPENMNKRSQDLSSSYHDSGQLFWMKTSTILTKKTVFTDNTGAIELPETEVQDIDSLIDWEIAEIKYKYNENKLIQ